MSCVHARGSIYYVCNAQGCHIVVEEPTSRCLPALPPQRGFPTSPLSAMPPLSPRLYFHSVSQPLPSSLAPLLSPPSSLSIFLPPLSLDGSPSTTVSFHHLSLLFYLCLFLISQPVSLPASILRLLNHEHISWPVDWPAGTRRPSDSPARSQISRCCGRTAAFVRP